MTAREPRGDALESQQESCWFVHRSEPMDFQTIKASKPCFITVARVIITNSTITAPIKRSKCTCKGCIYYVPPYNIEYFVFLYMNRDERVVNSVNKKWITTYSDVRGS